MKKDISMEEPSFSEESQQWLDALLGSKGFSWHGLAVTLVRRHGPFSMGIFIMALTSECDKKFLEPGS